MTVKEYLESTFKEDDEYNIRKRVVCKDGYSVSVQGGNRLNYCQPREIINIYHSVELGFPSEPDELINKYAEGYGTVNFTQTVYPFVDIEIVEKLIQKHGGMIDA